MVTPETNDGDGTLRMRQQRRRQAAAGSSALVLPHRQISAAAAAGRPPAAEEPDQARRRRRRRTLASLASLSLAFFFSFAFWNLESAAALTLMGQPIEIMQTFLLAKRPISLPLPQLQY